MKNVSYQLLISLRLQVVMKTLRNSGSLTFIQGVFCVFEKQPFTNVKKSLNSWSEKFLKIHRKALQTGRH